jgi:hypothetical protein
MQAATAECLAARAEHSDDNVVAAAQDSVRDHFNLMTQVPNALSQRASESGRVLFALSAPALHVHVAVAVCLCLQFMCMWLWLCVCAYQPGRE